MARDFVSDVARAAPPASGTGAGELLVGVALGGVGAALALKLPPILAVLLAMLLCGFALASRFEMRSIATSLVILTSFLMPMNRLLVGPTVPLSDVILVIVVGLYFLMRITEHRPPSNVHTYRPVVIGLVILGAGGFVGAVFEAPGPFMYKALGVPIRDVAGWGQNLANLGKFLLGSLLPMAFWVLVRPSRALMRRIVGAFVSGAFVSALIAVVFPFGKGGSRAIGLTVHPGQLGSLSLLGTGAALGLLMSRRQIRPWAILVLPTLAMAIILSGSRAALGGLVVLGLIVGPLTRSKAVIGGVIVAAALGLVLLGGGAVQPEGENAIGRALGNDPHAQNSNEIREELGSNVWNRFTQRPFTGNGYNYMRPSHNVYLGVLASAGILGIIGFATVITAVLRRSWRHRADLLSACISAAYLAYLAVAYYDNIFWWRWLWFTVGMVVAVTTTSPGRGEAGFEEPTAEDQPVDELAGSTR